MNLGRDVEAAVLLRAIVEQYDSEDRGNVPVLVTQAREILRELDE